MIVAIVGKPGAGKSYTGCVRILKEAQTGRDVVTDMPLTREKWEQYPNVEILPMANFKDVESWTCLDREHARVELVNEQPMGPYVVVDEAGQVFAGLGTNETQRVLGLLAEHRHSYADVILLVQHHSRLPVEVKNLVDEWVECVSYRKTGISGYSWASYARWYGARSAIATSMGRYDKAVFELYDSHALGAGAGGRKGEVVTASTVARFWLRWPVLLLVGSSLSLVYVLSTGWDRIGRMLGGQVGTVEASEYGFGKEEPEPGLSGADLARGIVAAGFSERSAGVDGDLEEIVRWVGVVGDGVLVERADGRQEMLSGVRLAGEGWSITGEPGNWYLVGSDGVRVYQ